MHQAIAFQCKFFIALATNIKDCLQETLQMPSPIRDDGTAMSHEGAMSAVRNVVGDKAIYDM